MSKKTTEDSDDTVGYKPDFKLKKMIGVDVPLNKIFTPKRIAAGNKVIQKSRDGFFKAAAKEVEKLLALVDSTTAEAKEILPNVAAIATSLKGEGEMYAFPLIQKICSHIMETCRDDHEKMATKLALIRDLTHALNFCIKNEIKDDGGETGKALLADMSRYRALDKSRRSKKI